MSGMRVGVAGPRILGHRTFASTGINPETALIVMMIAGVVEILSYLVRVMLVVGWELLRLCWRAGRATLRWAIRREQAHKAALVVVAALALGTSTGVGAAHADPGDPGIDPSDTCTLLYCPPPRYSGWGDGAADCNYVLGHWQASNGYPCRVAANP